jgi:phosphoglycerol transferase MdoB-like AlkP superfamily enzyme
LLAWASPDGPRSRRFFTAVALALALAAFVLFVLVAAAEFVFWNEFAARFNFIAVDYLVFTHEVLGNIRESYPLPLLLAGVGTAALAIFAAALKPLLRAAAPDGMRLAARTRAFDVLAAIPVLSFAGLDAGYKDFTTHAPSGQLAGNGWYEFLHAFRVNEIDYPQFYRTETAAKVAGVLREEVATAGPMRFVPGARLPIEREIVGRGAERRLNVVLITVESLSADFLGAFGNRKGLTPRLDALGRESLVFSRMYATGTRTVRGLEAIELSLPPTPGQSVLKRPHNDHLRTLGAVFADRGYEPIYLYGGYSYFDNMREFFSGNGYTVIDRSSLASGEIHYENIWGVADEDLYTLTLRELDTRSAAGRPFFAHVMTTSNHRPFSYPAGRIDIPSGRGRDGAVKYTDWALGNFIDRARGKDWFSNTLFVILADHCASSTGSTELPIGRFHIPLIVYAPGLVAPGRSEALASQIDVGPTLLGLLNFSYTSRFFGQDILAEGPGRQRALIGNYQTIGYLKNGTLVELRPKGAYRFVDAASGAAVPESSRTLRLMDEAIAYYQGASEALHNGSLRASDGVPGS